MKEQTHKRMNKRQTKQRTNSYKYVNIRKKLAIDWFIDLLMDWWIDGLIDGLMDWWIDGLMDW